MDMDHQQIMRLPRFTREEVTTWFREFDVSFVDPQGFCNLMTDMRENNDDLAELNLNERARQESGVRALWGILQDVAEHPRHRHRQDARNIIEEVEARERGEDEGLLIPDPLPLPYLGANRLNPPYPRLRPDQEMNIQNIAATLPRRLPDDDLPIPFIRVQRENTGPAPDPAAGYEYNDDLGQWIPIDMVAAEQLRIGTDAAIGAFGSIEDRGLLPYKYVDDPAEDVLNMPDECPFIDAPTPPHDERLLDQTTWPALEIYDDRTGGATLGPISATHYIYKILAWARLRMAQPETARAYCMVFRGNPRRFQMDTDDEILDEPPPTSEEVNTMIGFITKTMPIISIFRAASKWSERALGYHLRRKPHMVYMNGRLFDAIERMHRANEDPSATVWLTIVTFFHECGHYYFTVLHGPGIVLDMITPRKLRYLVSHNKTDAENHPNYNPWYIRHGEMGEIIEWLIFGVYTSVIPWPDDEPPQELYCLCWGSYLAQMDNIIQYGPYVASRLIRTPARMNNERLRIFIRLCDEQVRLGLDQQAAAEQMAGIQPAGDGTAAGVVQFMDTEMIEAGARSGDDLMDVDVAEDTEFDDVDSDFTGYDIGEKKAYRRAIWRVKAEIMASDNGSPNRDPGLGDYRGKDIPDVPAPPNAPQLKDRPRVVFRAAPLVPRTLPDQLEPWTLMLGISVYTALCMWGFMNFGPWYLEWLDEVHWSFKMAHVFGTVVISLWIYGVPFRRLLKPLGMVRLARHGYFDWRTLPQNPYNIPRFMDTDWVGRPTPLVPRRRRRHH